MKGSFDSYILRERGLGDYICPLSNSLIQLIKVILDARLNHRELVELKNFVVQLIEKTENSYLENAEK